MTRGFADVGLLLGVDARGEALAAGAADVSLLFTLGIDALGYVPTPTTTYYLESDLGFSLQVDAELDQASGPTVPAVPSNTEIGFSLDVEAEALQGLHVYADVDVSLELGVEALPPNHCEVGFWLHMDASSATAPQAYGYMVAQPPIVVGMAGMQYVRAHTGVALDASSAGLYAAAARAMLALGARAGSRYQGEVRAADAVAFGERLSWLRLVLAEDGIVLGANATVDYRALARATSRLLIEGRARHLTEALAMVTDAMVFGYLVDALALGAARDTLLARASVASLYHAFARAVDTLLFQGAATAENHMFAFVADRVVFAASVAHDADLVALLRSSIGFAASITVDSGEYIAWAMNTETTGLSRYTNYPYNSFARIGGVYHGVAPDGLYRLEGTDDNGDPIPWRLRLGLSDLGDRLIKRIPEMYYAYSGSITYIKVVSIDEVTGERNVAVYRATPSGAVNTREARKGLAAGIKSVDWDIILEGEGEFALEGLTLYPLSVERRTRS